MTWRGKQGSGAMAGAGATSPALSCLASPARPALPCHALPHPTPPQARGITCPSCLSPCAPVSGTRSRCPQGSWQCTLRG